MQWTLDTTPADPRLLEARFSGELSADDLGEFVAAVIERTTAGDVDRVLVDESGLTSTMSADTAALRSVATTIMRDRRLRALRIALIAPSDDAFGLSRMVTLLAGEREGVGVFRSRQAALRFLARQPLA